MATRGKRPYCGPSWRRGAGQEVCPGPVQWLTTRFARYRLWALGVVGLTALLAGCFLWQHVLLAALGAAAAAVVGTYCWVRAEIAFRTVCRLAELGAAWAAADPDDPDGTGASSASCCARPLAAAIARGELSRAAEALRAARAAPAR